MKVFSAASADQKEFATMGYASVATVVAALAIVLAPLFTIRIGPVKPVELVLGGVTLFVVLTLLRGRSVRVNRFLCLMIIVLSISWVWSLYIAWTHQHLIHQYNKWWADGVYRPFIWNTLMFAQVLSGIVFLNFLYKQKVNLRTVQVAIDIGIAIQAAIGAYQVLVLHYPFARGTFTEKGPYSMYIALLVVLRMMLGGSGYNGKVLTAVISYSSAVLAIVMSHGVRGIMLLIFWLFANGLAWRQARAIPMLLAISLLILRSPLGDYVWMKVVEEYYGFLVDSANEYRAIGRYAALYVVPRIVREFPLLGVGIGNYVYFRNVPMYAGLTPRMALDYPNSVLFQVAAEVGVVGGLLFAFSVFGFVKHIHAYWKGKVSFLAVVLIFSSVTVLNDPVYWVFLAVASSVIQGTSESHVSPVDNTERRSFRGGNPYHEGID